MGIRINALTETTSPGDTDNGVLDTSAGTRRITWSNIKTAIFGAINGLTSKSTPVGADVIAIGDSAASFAGKSATLNAVKTFVQVTRAEWRANTHAGYGSTDTRIPYFTNIDVNVDTAGAMTIVNNATNGCRVTINTAGRYAISYWFIPSGANAGIGISINSSQLTTNIGSITAANRVAFAGAVDGVGSLCSITLDLEQNDVIRPHGNAIGAGAFAAISGFSIVRVG